MKLSELAYPIDNMRTPSLAIDDEELLRWTQLNGIPPAQAQLEALLQEIIPSRYLQNFSAINLAEQIKICRSSALVCGCGGLGGVLINLLARIGVGKLRIIDGDSFVLSNLNRQLFSDTLQISRSKTQVSAERVHAINPFAQVEVHSGFIDHTNAEALVNGVDIVLDALDNLPARYILGDTAKRIGVPFIHAAVAGWWGQVSTFLPQSSLNLESIYGNRQSRDPEEIQSGVLGPTVSTIASLEAMEAVRILIGRTPAYADRILYLDGETGRLDLLPLE